MVWQGLTLSIGRLVTIEQLYRNVTSVRLPSRRPWSCFAFIYDIYLYGAGTSFR